MDALLGALAAKLSDATLFEAVCVVAFMVQVLRFNSILKIILDHRRLSEKQRLEELRLSESHRLEIEARRGKIEVVDKSGGEA